MKSVDLFLRNLRNLRFLLAKAEQLQRKHRRLPSKGRGVLECEGGRPGTFHVKHRNTAPPSVSRETPRRSARRKRSADDADRKPQKTQKAGSQSAGYGKRRRAKRLDGWLPGYWLPDTNLSRLLTFAFTLTPPPFIPSPLSRCCGRGERESRRPERRRRGRLWGRGEGVKSKIFVKIWHDEMSSAGQ